MGYISYNNSEGNISLFARKNKPVHHFSNITEDHYNRWSETHKNELQSYGIKKDSQNQVQEHQHLSGKELIDIKNEKFLNPMSGYLKKSSAQANYPVRSYKPKGIWPDKFKTVLEQINKYPTHKHFVFSRHKEAGSNAVGYYLEKNGWTRLSNNRYDHGSNPPKTNNKIGEFLFKLQSKFEKGEIDQTVYNAERNKVIRAMGPKKPYKGFIVLNSSSSQKEIKYARNMFNGEPNSKQYNVDGDLLRVFIADEKFAEGVSLYNALHIHLLEPPYNYQTEEQAIGRIVRLCGHKGIQPAKRVVNIHKYYASHNNMSMTNTELQDFNDTNQLLLNQLQKAAVEASLEEGLATANLDKDATKDLFIFKRLSEAVGKLN